MRRRLLRPFLAAAFALVATAAVACGHCVEDRVAAVYDYGTELQAGSAGERIAYLGVEGRRAESPRSAAAVGEALRACPAVTAGSVRTSVSPAATAFAWQGGEQALAEILQRVNGQLAAAGLRLELLRIWDLKQGWH